MTELVNVETREDRIKISEEVVMTIAGIAASEVESVVSMSGGLTDGIAGMFGKKNMGKGVKVDMNEKDVVIDLSIIVEYGCRIHIVAKQIQNKVREAVEEMTGLNVTQVNINILGVNIAKETKKGELVEAEQ